MPASRLGGQIWKWKKTQPWFQGAVSPAMEGSYDKLLWNPTQSKEGLAQKTPEMKCHWCLVRESGRRKQLQKHLVIEGTREGFVSCQQKCRKSCISQAKEITVAGNVARAWILLLLPTKSEIKCLVWEYIMWGTSLHTHMSKAISTWQSGASVLDVTFWDRHGSSAKNLYQNRKRDIWEDA